MSKPVTIIMIEDDEGHARLIERNIRRSGVNNDIVPFSNGTAAVNYLFGSDGSGLKHKGEALLILLDLNLPDMTGIEILRRVKESKFLKCAPVVVLTTTGLAGRLAGCDMPVVDVDDPRIQTYPCAGLAAPAPAIRRTRRPG